MDLAAIGRQFGLDEQQTQAAFDALAPVVAAGLRRNTQSDDGLAGLLGALSGGGNARYAEDPSLALQPDTVNDGNAILGHIFGSKDVSRGVAQQLSASSGIGESVLKKLLPIVAAMVMGQIARKTFGGGASGGGGGLADILGGMLGGGASRTTGSGGGLGDILGEMLGGGQSSAPQPRGGSGGGGLGDILGDLLGGGARPETPRQMPRETSRPTSGGGLDDILRDVLGGGAASEPERQERVTRTRRGFEDILGGGTSRGSAAEELLRGVEERLRRR